MSAIDDLAAALDGHQITDEQGQMQDETDTSMENTAAPEAQTTAEEAPTAEKPAETPQPAPKAEEGGTETELGVDETGKRYIPEKRFKDVYGKMKELERELETSKKSAQVQQTTQPDIKPTPTLPVDKTEALEVEILKGKLPQFDPESESYDADLDQLGAEILRANPGITKIEAARKAISYQKKLVKEMAQVTAEARTVKAIQSDQGITGHVAARSSSQPDFSSMSDVEMEKYLKETGQW